MGGGGGYGEVCGEGGCNCSSPQKVLVFFICAYFQANQPFCPSNNPKKTHYTSYVYFLNYGECLTTPQHKNKSSTEPQTKYGIYIKKKLKNQICNILNYGNFVCVCKHLAILTFSVSREPCCFHLLQPAYVCGHSVFVGTLCLWALAPSVCLSFYLRYLQHLAMATASADWPT